MFERFTDQARHVIAVSQEEARLLHHNFIDTEHILLGLIHEDGGIAAQALNSLGIGLEAARDQIKATVGPARSSPTEARALTPGAKTVLELSLREALQIGHNDIRPEHILLSLVRERDCVAAHVLVDLGADLSLVRPQVMGLMQAASSEHRELTGERGRLSGREAPQRQRGVDGPRCTNGHALENNVGFRALAVQPIGASATAEPVEVMFVYCLSCGVVVAHLPTVGLTPPR